MKIDNTNPNIKNDDGLPCSRPYSAPEIIFETELETNAGTPLGSSDPGISLPGFDQADQ